MKHIVTVSEVTPTRDREFESDMGRMMNRMNLMNRASRSAVKAVLREIRDFKNSFNKNRLREIEVEQRIRAIREKVAKQRFYLGDPVG